MACLLWVTAVDRGSTENGLLVAQIQFSNAARRLGAQFDDSHQIRNRALQTIIVC